MARFQKKHVAMLAVLSTAIVLLTCILYLATQVERAYEMPMSMTVIEGSKKAGFDLNLTAVTFGRISPGMGVTRYFTIDNTGDRPVKAIIKAYGDITPFVTITPLTQIITPEQRQGKVEAEATVPQGTPPGSYTGRLVVIVLRQ